MLCWFIGPLHWELLDRFQEKPEACNFGENLLALRRRSFDSEAVSVQDGKKENGRHGLPPECPSRYNSSKDQCRNTRHQHRNEERPAAEHDPIPVLSCGL